MTKRRIALVSVLTAVVAAFSIVPLAASSSGDARLVASVRVDFTSSTHAVGTSQSAVWPTTAGLRRPT